ncbi:MAG: TonB-dependent receptor domain-containing protein [Pseudohongiellaceae bacterium]
MLSDSNKFVEINTRGALLFACLCLLMPAAEAAEGEAVEEIVVTGSHIRAVAADASLPVTTLSREDLTEEGSPSVVELVRSMSFSQGADGETEPFQGFPGTGADRASVNLRGLGPSRTLVLVNGKRMTWSPLEISGRAELLVDVNAIPSIALQRVEVLRDGAAATYGSDAISGVVNFITRSDFEGFEVNVSHQAIADSDGDSEFGAIAGRSFMERRAHVVTSANYAKRNLIKLNDRDWAVVPFAQNNTGGWSAVGRPAVFVPYDEFDATAGGQEGFLQSGIVDPNCTRLGGAITNTPAANPAGGFCRFQYTPFFNLVEETERWQWMTEARFDFSDTTALALEFLLAESEVPVWRTSPSYPPNQLVDRSRSLRANNPGLIDMAGKYPAMYGDYAACEEAYCRYLADPVANPGRDEQDEVAWIYGRYYGQDGPVRTNYRQSEFMRFAATLEGGWGGSGNGGDDYGWQLSANWSASERESELGDTMAYRDERAREGLGGFECERMVPNEYNTMTGQLEFSAATLQQWAGVGPCRYWIPFSNGMYGSHPLVPDAIGANPDYNPALDNRPLFDYLLTNNVSVGETSLLSVEGIINGELGRELDGGRVGFALGFQYREETYKSREAAGSFTDGALFPCREGPEVKVCDSPNGLFNFLPPRYAIDEEHSIWAVFAEFLAPFSDSFEARLSVRHEDYGGLTGSTTDPKLAIRWQATESLGFRASVGTTFRGPTLNQSIAGNASNTLAYIGQTGAFKRIDTDGNPALKPEQANTLNAGLLYDQSGLLNSTDNFFMTLDYWSYDFSDPIVVQPYVDLLAQVCPDEVNDPCDQNNPFFGQVGFGGAARAANVESIQVNVVNGPDYETHGIDFTLRYGMGAGSGYLTADLTGTRLLAYDIAAWEFGAQYNALGRLNYDTTLARTLTEWKAQLTLNYAWTDLNLRLTTSYVGNYQYIAQAPQPAGDATAPSHATHDLHLSYRLIRDRLTLVGSIINLSDEDPPYVPREFNYDALTHNPLGRIFKVGVNYSL